MTVQVFDKPARSNPAVGLVRDAWMAIGQGDYDCLARLMANDILWSIPAMPNVPFAGDWHGWDGVLRFFQTVDEAQESIDFSPSEVIADNERVVVLGAFQNRVKATGRLSKSTWAQIWTVRDGRIASMVEFVDTNAVNQAFGA